MAADTASVLETTDTRIATWMIDSVAATTPRLITTRAERQESGPDGLGVELGENLVALAASGNSGPF